MLDKKLRTADKDISPAWKWAGADISSRRHVTKCHTGPRTCPNSLIRHKHRKRGLRCGLVLASSYEDDNEPSVP